jgi:hypothetical protein
VGDAHLIPKLTLEICSNTEWLRVYSGICFEGIPEEDMNNAATTYQYSIFNLLKAEGFECRWAIGARSLCHGWNGYMGFKHNFSFGVGTFSLLGEQLVNKIQKCATEAEKIMKDCFTDKRILKVKEVLLGSNMLLPNHKAIAANQLAKQIIDAIDSDN